jgi:DNA-binding transcriptional LysR family regulator
LQQRHPALEIEMRLEERMVNLAAEGVDLAVLPEPFIPSGNVVARYLTRSQMVLCASPAYLAGAACLNGPAELAAHACIGFNHGPMLRRWSLFHRGQRVEVPVRCVFASNQLQLITEACRRGQGVALLLESQVREALDHGQLSRVLPQWTGHEIEYFVAYPSRKLMPRAVRLVLEEVLSSFSTLSTHSDPAEALCPPGARAA